MVKMKKTRHTIASGSKIFMVLMIMIMGISMVSALELNPFADKKIVEKEITPDMSEFIKADFNEDYGVIRLSQTFFWFETDRIAEYSLTKNTELCLVNCEAEGKVTLYTDGILFSDVQFKALDGSASSVKSSEYFVMDGYLDNYVNVPATYKQVCVDIPQNATKGNLTKEGELEDAPLQECHQVPDTYKQENHPIENWVAYKGQTLRAGDYQWKIKGQKDPMQSVDFIPLRYEKEFSEWAVWNSSFNSGLAGYFGFNEGTGAVTTNYANPKYNGTLIDGVTWETAGKNGSATRYDGSSYVLINSSLTLAVTGQTFNVWVNLSSTSQKGAFMSNSYIGDTGVTFGVSSGSTTFTTTGNVMQGLYNYVGWDNTGKSYGTGWHMASLVGTGTGIKYYIDGVNVFNSTNTPNALNDNFFLIGENQAGHDSNRGYNDVLDEAMMWNRTLAPNEILDLYNGGTGIFWVNTDAPTSSLTVVNSYPADLTNFTTASIGFGCNATSSGTTNITSVTLNVNGTATWSQTVTGLNTKSYNATFTNATILNGAYTWNCTVVGSDLNASSSFRSFNQQAYTNPSVLFNTQTPADLNLTNFIGVGGVNITYNISSSVGIPLSNSTIKLYYKSNDTLSNVMYYQNGTANSGYFPASYDDNVSLTYRWNLKDNNVLQGTYNYGEITMENTAHLQKTLANNDLLTVEILNVSSAKAFSFYEIMANSTNIMQFYYCNSTYAFANNPTTNANCVLIFTETANDPYDHIHTAYSSHHVMPFAINEATGQVGTVKVTSTSYFIGKATGTMNYYVINNASRSNAFRVSTNNGNTWTSNDTITVDAHLHQFSSSANSSIWYYACANDTNNNANCTTPRQDPFELGSLPPTSPQVYAPINTTYARVIDINYTASQSPNGYAISNYNITLWNSAGTFNQTLRATSTTLGYSWNSSALKSGSFYVRVDANDTLNQKSYGISEIFSLDNINPNITLVSPANNTYTNNSIVNFTANISDNNGINYTILNVYNSSNGVLINQTTSFWGGLVNFIIGIPVTLVEGVYHWFYTAVDQVGNSFTSENKTVTIDQTSPNIAITYPQAIKYNINVSALNYTIIEKNPFNCWYSLNDGLANTTMTCGNNVTGLTSAEGVNIWRVWINDSVAYQSTASITFQKDTIKPLLVINSPASQNYSSYRTTLNFTSTDANLETCYYTVNGGSGTTAPCTSGVPTIVSLPSVEGTYNYSVYVNDTFGNTNMSSVTFYVNLTKVYLETPADAYQIASNPYSFVCNSTSNPPYMITNMSLWDNSTGVWARNQTGITTALGSTLNLLDGNAGGFDGSNYKGFSIIANRNFMLRSVTLMTLDASTTCNVYDYATNTILDTASVVGGAGGTATFNYNLVAGQQVHIQCGGSGTADRYILTAFSSADARNHGTDFNVTESLYGLAVANNGHRTIMNITSGTGDPYSDRQTFSTTITKPTLWSCEVCDDSGSCFMASENRTVAVDLTAPTFTLNSLPNVSTLTLPVNAVFNVTTTDGNLLYCNYSTSDNPTPIAYQCNNVTNVSFATGGSKTITIYGTDVLGNTNSTTYPVSIYHWTATQSGNSVVGEGSSQTFTLTLNSHSFSTDADATLFYAGVDKGITTKTTINATAMSFTKTFILANGSGSPSGQANDWEWRFNTTTTPNKFTANQTQTVYSVTMTDCALTTGRVILNMSLKDEELNTLANTTSPNTAIIEVDVTVTSLVDGSVAWDFAKTWNNNKTVAICVPNGLLNLTSYRIDFTTGYESTSHVKEFYYLDNGTLDNTNYFNSYTDNTVDLMDLASADSTTFLFEFTDTDGLKIPNAIVHTFRKYIGEGIFREVERSKQDDNGQTHVHLVEEDVIYYFMITEDGTILYTSANYNAKCLSTPCQISLTANPTEINWSIIDNEGGAYQVSTNKATRVVTTAFSIDSSDLVNVSLYKVIDGEAVLLNQSSLTSMSGSINLGVPLAYGNATYFVAIYRNNTFVKSSWIDMTESGKNYFGTFGVILAGLIVLTMMLMAVSEGVGFIIFTVLALIIVGAMQLVELSWLAIISIICAGGIIIWKLVNRRATAQ